jgi:hypothetical protein
MEPLPPGLRYSCHPGLQEGANSGIQLSLEVIENSSFSKSKTESESSTDLEEDTNYKETSLVEAAWWMADYKDSNVYVNATKLLMSSSNSLTTNPQPMSDGTKSGTPPLGSSGCSISNREIR